MRKHITCMDTEWISFCILSQECKNIFPLQTHHTHVFILELPLQLRQQTPCQYDNSFLLCVSSDGAALRVTQ